MKRPSAYGNVLERYLFNFRIGLEDLIKHMPPLKWLEPTCINGYGVISLCMVHFRGLTAWPFPKALGINTVTCAYRYSVVDMSNGEPVPAVYLLSRNTDNSFVNCFGPPLLSSKVGKITSSIKKDEMENIDINLGLPNGEMMFSATVLQSKRLEPSLLFESEKEFEELIENGKVSFTPATDNGRYSRHDLESQPYYYEQVNADIHINSIEQEWDDVVFLFDSAYRTSEKTQYKIVDEGLYNEIC